MKMVFLYVLLVVCSFFEASRASARELGPAAGGVRVAAQKFDHYLPLLQGKRVGLLVNNTSVVGHTLLPDTLLSLGVNVVAIYSPEHGFRGNADAGARVKDEKDEKTGLPVISLYGKNKKPTAEQLKGIDVLVYDIQDVGVRFYTYISSLQYAMEACAENRKVLMVLDRPNPMGNIVDGPVLEKKHASFIGMQPIPVVYGMTPGEYAKMLLGEGWLAPGPSLDLMVITCDGYDHDSIYALPVPPSPNLKNMTAVYLYPSLCFFEGTQLSLGRGTDKPFQQFGHPLLKGYSYSFVPVPMPGANDPPLKNKKCYGELVATDPEKARQLVDGKLRLKWLLEAYKAFPDKGSFFTPFFEKLSGTDELRKQIEQGLGEDEIRASWAKDLEAFRQIRKKYLLYWD